MRASVLQTVRAKCLRPISARAAQADGQQVRHYADSASQRGIVEIREYTLKPEGTADYLRLAAESSAARKRMLPFLGMFTCDIGSLNKVTHIYCYKDLDERDKLRGEAMKNPDWKKFVLESRSHVASQCNKIMLQAGPIYDALKLPCTGDYKSPANPTNTKVVYELRTYQLHPGYGSVPKLVEAFSKGLPDKVAADPEGQLVFFGHTDVGMLNNVMELWRYPSAQACIRARQAARSVPSWRETIASVTPGVQHFTSEFLNPVPFSPWQ